MSGMHGLLLFAHGARDSRWALPFDAIVERVRAQAPGVPVELGFLEFMTPALADAGHRLAAAGCTHVDVVPLFLGAGGHVRRDIPLLLAELEAAHAGVQWELRPAIGEVDSVVDAMAAAALGWLHRE
jgi:sirohydrochlorin cobaltochelatase